VLLHPIRNNINSSVQQLASLARALPVDAQQVPICLFAAAVAKTLAR